MDTYFTSDGVTPASAKAAGPDQTAAVYVRSTLPPIWCLTASPAPSDERTLEALRHLWLRHHNGAAAVGDDAAIEAMQRIGDVGRGHDLLYCHDLAQERVGIVLGVLRGRHLDPGELGARRAVLMHVAHRR